MSQETIFKERLGDYWYCENVDTWVPVGVSEIKSLDQVNNYFILTLNSDQHKQSVAQTLLRGKEKELTVEEYHEKFCEFKEGKWIWKSVNEIKSLNRAPPPPEEGWVPVGNLGWIRDM